MLSSIKRKASSKARPEIEEVEDEVDYTLGLPRPYYKHRQLLKDLREAESQHIDPERFRYNVDAADARILTEPDAAIVLHVLEVHDISLRVTSFNRTMPMFFYLLVSVGRIRRITNIGLTDTKRRVRIDSLLHFSIKVPQFRDNINNRLRIELWAFQDPEIHYILSTKDIHIYELIREIHGIHITSMWTDALRVAKVVFEFAFSYGAFGYGHSNQLKNTDCTIFEAVQNSIFPRLATETKDNTESYFKVYIPAKLHLLSLNSYIFEAPKKDIEKEMEDMKKINPLKKGRPRIFNAHQVEFQNGFPVHCKVNMNIYQKEIEAEFNNIYGTFLCFTKRRERLDFLSSLLTGRLDDLKETRFGALFRDLDEGVIEKIIDADIDPHRRIYPFRNPCTENPTVLVLEEDEPFFDKFPSLSRTTGYLGRLFGFTPIQSDPHYRQEEYPVEECYLPTEDEIPIPWYRITESTAARLWRYFRAALNAIYLCLFPELKRHTDIPEISVTLASPQGSTTDLYVQWFEDESENALFRAKQKIAKQLELEGKKRARELDENEQYELDELGTDILKEETAFLAQHQQRGGGGHRRRQ